VASAMGDDGPERAEREEKTVQSTRTSLTGRMIYPRLLLYFWDYQYM
jgi:hypothetical protein